jgi:hypothetical protein
MGARVKSDIFVAALLRSASSMGAFGAIVGRGHSDAGQVLIVGYDSRSGTHSLWAPAPQSLVADRDTVFAGGRLFERRLNDADPTQIDAFIDSEKRFDSDIWIVEIEADDDQLKTLFDTVD